MVMVMVLDQNRQWLLYLVDLRKRSYILIPGLIFFRVQNIGVLFFSSQVFDQFEFTI